MTREEKQKIYAALAAPFAEHCIQRTEGRVTGRGYDTTGVGYQHVVNRLNEVLGIGSWRAHRTVTVKEIVRSNGRPAFEAIADITYRAGRMVERRFRRLRGAARRRRPRCGVRGRCAARAHSRTRSRRRRHSSELAGRLMRERWTTTFPASPRAMRPARTSPGTRSVASLPAPAAPVHVATLPMQWRNLPPRSVRASAPSNCGDLGSRPEVRVRMGGNARRGS